MMSTYNYLYYIITIIFIYLYFNYRLFNKISRQIFNQHFKYHENMNCLICIKCINVVDKIQSY